eukprot:5126154-Amphidinium_carterae.1
MLWGGDRFLLAHYTSHTPVRCEFILTLNGSLHRFPEFVCVDYRPWAFKERNTAGRVFGGFLMRRCYELAFASCFAFSGSHPVFVEVTDFLFTKPVTVPWLDCTCELARALCTSRLQRVKILQQDVASLDVHFSQQGFLGSGEVTTALTWTTMLQRNVLSEHPNTGFGLAGHSLVQVGSLIHLKCRVIHTVETRVFVEVLLKVRSPWFRMQHLNEVVHLIC